MTIMKVFTDASFWGNPHQQKNANLGIFIPTIDVQFKEQVKVRDNNEAEYFAIFKALQIVSKKFLNKKTNLTIVSDSKVCTYSLNQWVTTGIHRPNKYNKIQYKIFEIIQSIDLDIIFQHQKAHSKFDMSEDWLGNNIADKLSKREMNKIDIQYFEKYLKMFNKIFFGPIQENKKYNDAWD